MRTLRPLALALNLVPSIARAADLQVTYTVQEKQLKAAIATTPLTFELHGNGTCTALVQSTAVAVENVSLITKLKQFTPKNDTKLPNTVELRTVLAGVAPAAPLYLKVTGTGVVPVGGACQVQAAAGLGSGPATGRVVKDVNGATLGAFDEASFGRNTLLSVGGRQAFASVTPNGFALASVDLVFTSSGCTGPALYYVDSTSLVTVAYALGTTLYAYPATGTSTTYNSRLHREPLIVSQTECNLYFAGAPFVAPDGCCIPETSTTDLAPVLTEDVSGFVPPFHVE
jgi:hypothetical protein